MVPKRPGMVHVPKCAGTALAAALRRAYGLRLTHISNVVPKGEARRRWDLERDTLAHTLACDTPFLSGHVGPRDMRSLGRDYVFTVLREPAARLFSVYTYMVTRSHVPEAVARNPQFADVAKTTFAEFVEAQRLRSLASYVLDVRGWRRSLDWVDHLATLGYDPEAAGRGPDHGLGPLAGRLERLDDAFGDVPLAARVVGRRLGRTVRLERRNDSDASIPYRIGASRAALIDLVGRAVAPDRAVYEAARARQPHNFDPSPLPPVAGVVEAWEGRYDMRYER